MVPPLFLQPLVENAVKHGIAGMVDGGIIEVDAHCENGWLQVKIENAYDPDAPPATRHGLGLENVRGRLRALYENQARLDTEASRTTISSSRCNCRVRRMGNARPARLTC